MVHIKLDKELENVLFNEMDACFYQRKDAARFNAESDKQEVCSYLGTYFPRSWAEHTVIWRQVLQFPAVKEAFKKKPVIRILDVGSGTGGHSFAVIQQLRKNFKQSRIKIIAIDANEYALAKQQELHERLMYNGLTIKPVFCNFELSPVKFALKLLEICQTDCSEFDIILTSKFLSELGCYAERENRGVAGFYHSFLAVANKVLTQDGILTLVDVNIPIKNIYVAECMHREIHTAIEDNLDLAVMMPSHCGRFFSQCRLNPQCFMTIPIRIAHCLQSREDITKICFRVIARKMFTAEIFKEMQYIPRSIKVNDNGHCCQGTVGRGSGNNDYKECFC